MVIFDPRGLTLEEYNRVPPDVDLNAVEQIDWPLESTLPVTPSYITSFTADDVQQILTGKRPGPTTSIGAGLASILAANEVINVILKKRDIATAPAYTYIDLLDRKFAVGAVS